MLEFDSYNNVLKARKYPDSNINLDCLKVHKDSYAEYRELIIHQDVEDLVRNISSICNIPNLTGKVRIEERGKIYSAKEIQEDRKPYYSVLVDFNANGIVNEDIEILRLPHCDDYCVYTFGDSRKTLYSELTNLEDLSLDRGKEDKPASLAIVLPRRKFSLDRKSNDGFAFTLYKKSMQFHKAILKFAKEQNIDVSNLETYFANALVLRKLLDVENTFEQAIEDSNSKVRFYETLTSDSFKLGKLRFTMNNRLKIDGCKGYTLSRDIYLRLGGVVEKGTIIDEDVLRRLKKNLVNEVYVRCIPAVEGFSLFNMISLKKIKKGTRVTDLVKSIIGESSPYYNVSYIEEDINVDYIIPDESIITSDLLKLLYDNGEEAIRCYTSKKENKYKQYTFEQEFVGNYTAQLKDFLDDIPEGLHPEQYTYYYGVADPYSLTSVVNPEYFTTHDLIGVVSFFARVLTMDGNKEAYNRDLDFLKKVNLVSDIFSSSFRQVIVPFVRKYQKRIGEALRIPNNITGCRIAFSGFNDKWKHSLVDRKLLRPSNDINTLTMYSQALRIVTTVSSDRTVAPEMRMLTMSHDGRICPYDTPAGRKIGIVNTLTIGCRIEDGVLKAPRRVVGTGSGGKVIHMDDVRYLSPDEEQQAVVGDVLSILFNEDKTIKDSQVSAKIPSQIDELNRVRVGDISSLELEYVNAFGEQHLSPTPAAIPFAGADDGARVSFGINLYNQAKPILLSEAPLVYTDIYSQIYATSNEYVLRAKADGEVLDIRRNSIDVKYTSTAYQETIYTTHISEEILNCEDDCVLFRKGDILSTSPLVYAKWGGTIIDLEPDKIIVEYVTPDVDKVTEVINEKKIMNDSVILMDIKVKVGDTFRRGDVLADTPLSREGLFSPGRNVPTGWIINDGWNYEDATNMDEETTNSFTSMSPHKEERKVDVSNYSLVADNKYLGTFIEKNGVISELIARKKNDTSRRIVQEWRSAKHEGVLYRIDRAKDSYTSDSTQKRYVAKLLGFNRLDVADKTAGRHGNKGVLGKRFKVSETYTLRNGYRLSLTVNPCGVVSRMNIGQVLEGLAGWAAYLLGIKINSNSFNGMSTQEIGLLIQFVWDIANKYNLKVASELKAFKEKYNELIPDSLFDRAVERYDFIREFEGCFNPDGTADVYDPITGTYLKNKIVVGISYFLKIKQEVDSKMHVRGGMLDGEDYTNMTFQPPQGSSKGGGQANGEMEIMGIMGHGANNLAHEYMTSKADNIGARVNLNVKSLGVHDLPYKDEDCYCRTVDIMRFYLEVENINTVTDDFPGITQKDIRHLKVYDSKTLINTFVSKKKSNVLSGKKYRDKEYGAETVENVLDSSNEETINLIRDRFKNGKTSNMNSRIDTVSLYDGESIDVGGLDIDALNS